jgi:hypothetical protein
LPRYRDFLVEEKEQNQRKSLQGYTCEDILSSQIMAHQGLKNLPYQKSYLQFACVILRNFGSHLVQFQAARKPGHREPPGYTFWGMSWN